LSLDNPIVANNNFWFPWTVPAIKALVEGEYAARNAKLVILYGEIFGSKVQKGYEYNVTNGKFGYRAFDLLVDGKYIDTVEFRDICIQYGVDVVPELYCGPFSLAKIKELAVGKTVLGADHIREGVVVKPIAERSHPKIGRTVLKYVSDEFLATKDGKDFTDV
jgi:RNA ligase (TIGR02306 family)